jgi:drug/metabolite transporter (DMT)-like permease
MALPLTRVRAIGFLLLLGVGWGLTQPLGKLAASTGHPPLTLILWQTVICVVVLGTLTLLRGKGLVLTRRALVFYIVVAVLGTLVPNAAFLHFRSQAAFGDHVHLDFHRALDGLSDEPCAEI